MDVRLDWKGKLKLAARAAHTDVSNFHLVHYRNVDAFLITSKNSGTHWLKCMLSNAFAHQHGLPAPAFTSGREAEDFIAHPRWPQKHPELPHIGSSHNIPSALVTGPLARRALGLPPIVVLVRSIPEAMLSHWVKWGEEKGLSLSDYARLPAPGRQDIADVWWYLDFFNRWGRAARACPDKVLIVRYEDLETDTAKWLARTAAHLGVPLSPEAVQAGLAVSGQEFVRERLDPEYGEAIVPDRKRRAAAAFSPEDLAYLQAVFAERLEYDFGYGLSREGRPSVAPAAVAAKPDVSRSVLAV